MIKVPPNLIPLLPALRDKVVFDTSHPPSPPRKIYPEIAFPPQTGKRVPFIYQKHITVHDRWIIAERWHLTQMVTFVYQQTVPINDLPERFAATLRVVTANLSAFDDPMFRHGLRYCLGDTLHGGRFGFVVRTYHPLCYTQAAIMHALTEVTYLTLGEDFARHTQDEMPPLSMAWKDSVGSGDYPKWWVAAVLQLEEEGVLRAEDYQFPDHLNYARLHETPVCAICRRLIDMKEEFGERYGN